MSEFDDPVVRDQLQRLAGHQIDDDRAYADLQTRVRVAKRRRVAVAVSVVGGAALVVAAASMFVDNDTRSITPVASSTAQDPVVTDRTTDTKPSTTEPSAITAPPQTSAPATAAPSTGEGVPPMSTSSGTEVTQSPNPVATNSPATAATVPATPTVQVFTSKGGVLTVETKNGAISIADHDESPGYKFQIERSDPDRIRVRFIGSGLSSRIDVVVSNGKAIAHIAEIDDSTINTFDFPNNNNEDWSDRSNDGHDGHDGSWADDDGSGSGPGGDSGSGSGPGSGDGDDDHDSNSGSDSSG